MAERVSARLTAKQGRRFGCTVGIAFLVLAGVVWWRTHPNAAVLFGSLGAALTLAGLAIPTHLGPIERAWMGLAHAISRVTTPVMMAGIYFLVVTPVGLMRRSFAHNPLAHTASDSGFWKATPKSPSSGMERQF